MKKAFLSVALLAPTLAQAAESGAVSTTATLLKALGGLALVLGLVFLLYAISRRGLNLMPGTRNGRIKVVEMRSLGPKKGLCLVEVGGQELLLGVGAERVELLAKLGQVQPGAFDHRLRTELEKSP
ncbi:flagellar biosynthetic protein FliO [Geoalkalibacter halelectricus]|uniref:Flagellar protein n=1 Tax=Geoalkalibacter halelectricus TaxID=2847045 RepID=A0ABY5ZH15_9BACT|nr:flagellar biosynthetic protein FliO [Geoalkalibacter halelectricus]MDO3378065.1 flagellar biosynthetic protein FliO [Geoalkalibacter halelectricus]UWZ78363.1 flagellar biosynthetic protein FliO [Geoalkalibacter halelectricus]